MEKITKKTSLLYNQLWINKAIEEGNYDLLPCTKPSVCIGEYIEERYKEIEGKLETPKITKKESIIFNREWKLKAIEEGIKIPTRIISDRYSVGEMLEIKFLEIETQKELNNPERTLLLSGENITKKKILKR